MKQAAPSSPKQKKREKATLVILDAHALIHRAFHALPGLTSPQGEPVGAVYGVASILLKLIRELKPTHMAAAFDLPQPTFRHEVYEGYKAQRAEAPDELVAQFEKSRALIRAFGIAMFEKVGFEADDIIGALKERFKKEKNVNIVIVSGDLDVLQLVEGDRVVVYTMKKSLKDTITYNEAAVEQRFGFAPKYLPDFKGLKGDPSDNIMGVKGVGEKTASLLIQEYATLEKLYHALKKGKGPTWLSPRLTKILLEQEEEAFFSRELARIRLDVPLDGPASTSRGEAGDLASLAWSDIPFEKTERMLREFHFSSLVERLKGMKGDNSPSPPLSLREGIQENFPLNLRGTKGVIEELHALHLAAWLLNSEQKEPEDIDPASLSVKKEELIERLKQEKLYEWYRDVELPLAPILKLMERRGIALDKDQVEKTRRALAAEKKAVEERIFAEAGEEFNVSSPLALRRILFEKLKLSPKGMRKTPGGEISTQLSELAKLRYQHHIIADIMRHRELTKLLTTYVEPFARDFPEDGRVHSTFHQTATVTGRLSSSDPNMQNVPVKGDFAADIRKMFRASEGFTLVAFDYSQFELRIAAHLAQDKKMMEAFQRGEDIHRRTAAEVFNVAPEAVTPLMRRRAKIINFGILYGMGASALAEQLEVPYREAHAFLEEYFREFEGVARYRQVMLSEARKNGFVSTMVGRKRHLPTLNSSIPFVRAEAERMAINAPIQGSQADMIKKAMVAIARECNLFENDNVRLLLQIHDELVFEIKKEEVATFTPRIKKMMEEVETLRVPLVVDVRKGPSLGELK